MTESENKAIVGRSFTDFWGAKCNLGIVDELAAPEMLLHQNLREQARARPAAFDRQAGHRRQYDRLAGSGAKSASA
jgi:hypothetical protein